MTKSASEIFKTLGKVEAVPVLRELEENGPKGFNELKDGVRTDPKTLTRRLDELSEIQAVVKSEESDYYITKIGSELLDYSSEIEHTVNETEVNEVVQ